MISSEKLDASSNLIDTTTNNTAKQNKWNEQPHIGKYKLIKTIGKGNFAKVKLAQHVTTGKKVAVKVIDKTALNNSSLQKLFREVKIMKTLEHPNIVKLFEVIESERHVYLVMEYASRGEVFDFLVQNGRMKEKEARQRFREIVSAIQYCHQKNIVHRDLKAENLLLSCDLEIKIADFGFANNFDCKKQLDTFCGSPPYAAPELFQGRKYEGPEVDVWSLGVILYTLVSGSLPFDGHNMRELRERVLRGKYRIPFYMSTDCELLLKKMLIVNPQKRFTLLEVMKDKWINIGYEDRPLQPYREPAKNYEDPVRIARMEELGFSKEEVLDSLYNSKFNNVTATYLLLDHDVNNALESSSKSASVNSLKNINSYLSPKNNEETTSSGNDQVSNGVTRSGSAIDARLNSRIATNGDSKDAYHGIHNEKHAPLADGEITNTEMSLKVKHGKVASNIKQSPSMGAAHTIFCNDEEPQLSNVSYQSRLNPTTRIPDIQTNITEFNESKLVDDKPEMNNGDNLLIPLKNPNWVKRNNTFTYADKNTASEIESKPVTRTKHVMNMLRTDSNTTQSTLPNTIDQSNTLGTTKYGSNDVIIKHRNQDSKSLVNDHDFSHKPMTDSALNDTTTITEQPSTTGDILYGNTASSDDQSNIMLISVDEPVDNHLPTQLIRSNRITDAVGAVNNSVSSDKNPNDPYPNLNKPKPIHSSSLFRTLSKRISSSKLVRRLTSPNPSANQHKRASEHDATNSSDPWTPMDSNTVTNDKRKNSASSDLTGDKNLLTEKAHHTYTLKPNQKKPRLIHLVFRTNLTSKLRPDMIISETLKSLSTVEEIEFKKMDQTDNFVIECQGRLKTEHGGNELIHWEIEVFRLARSTSHGIRIKKESGSSTRFKAIQKVLINRLSTVLSTSPGHY